MAPTGTHSRVTSTPSPDSASPLKRKFDFMIADLQEQAPPPKKSKQKGLHTAAIAANNFDGPGLSPLKYAAKWFTRAQSPFMPIPSLMEVGTRLRTSAVWDPATPGTVVLPTLIALEESRMLKAYKAFLERVPEFASFVEMFAETGFGDDWKTFVSTLSEAALAVRVIDTDSIKDRLSYIIEDVPGSGIKELDPKIDIHSELNKSQRGWKHKQIAQLLCPYRHLDLLTEDHDSFLNQLMDGTIEVLPQHWPTFLYQSNTYDPLNIELGLMRGHILLRVARHIFTGPATWNNENPKPLVRRANASLIGVHQVTGPMIAYVAVQARHMISSQDTWTSWTDGTFKYDEFFKEITDMFTDEEDEWAIETLAWWQSRVFGLVAGKVAHAPNLEGSDAGKTKSCRVARKASRDAKAAAAAIARQADDDTRIAAETARVAQEIAMTAARALIAAHPNP